MVTKQEIEYLISYTTRATSESIDLITKKLPSPDFGTKINDVARSQAEFFKELLKEKDEQMAAMQANIEDRDMRPTMGQKLDQLTTSLGTSLEALKGHLNTLFEKICSVGKAISEKAKELGGKMSEFKDFVKGKMGELAESVKTFYTETMKPSLAKATEATKENFKEAMGAIKTKMENSADSVANVYLGAKKGLGAALEAVGSKLVNSGFEMKEKASDAKEQRGLKKKFKKHP
jgi:hypothetical protein